MIVKTFMGQDAKEIEERIFKIYGPEAIILTTIEVSPTEVHVSFGVEEEDFVCYQRKDNGYEDDDYYQLLHEEEEYSDDDFWDNDTIPDVEYQETTLHTATLATESDSLVDLVEKKMFKHQKHEPERNILDFLIAKGFSRQCREAIIDQLEEEIDIRQLLCPSQKRTQSLNRLFEAVKKLIPVTGDQVDCKLMFFSGNGFLNSPLMMQSLIRHFQQSGKTVRAACHIQHAMRSQEVDVVHTLEELSDYIHNYLPKCDHLLIQTPCIDQLLERWPNAHILHCISALWKPADSLEYITPYRTHKNSSLFLVDLEETSTPGSILHSAQEAQLAISFICQKHTEVQPANADLLVREILLGASKSDPVEAHELEPI